MGAVTLANAVGFNSGTRQPDPNKRMLATKIPLVTRVFLGAYRDSGSQFMDSNSLQLKRRVFRARRRVTRVVARADNRCVRDGATSRTTISLVIMRENEENRTAPTDSLIVLSSSMPRIRPVESKSPVLPKNRLCVCWLLKITSLFEAQLCKR